MDNIAGSPVEGENFFGREVEIAHFCDTLSNDDILLLGPRRIGKTSVARAVMARLRADGWRAVEINVAACVDERGVLDKLETVLEPEMASLASRTVGAVGDAFRVLGGRIKSLKVPVPGAGNVGVELGDGGAEDWAKVANDVLKLIVQAEERWLIYVDELPIFLFNLIRNDAVGGIGRVRRFLDWFRNDVRALPDARKVRWLVSGSVGLDTLAQQHGMADTINSMSHQTLQAFRDDMACAMLDKLASRYGLAWSADAAAQMVAAVQWPQPYYLQAAFHHLRSLHAADTAAAPASLIGAAVDRLAEPGSDNDFHHWEGRLSLQLPRADADMALFLLNRIAPDSAGVRAEILLAAVEERMSGATADEARRTFIRLRDILQRDAYWWPDDSSGARRYRFRLEPLRRWWLRRDTL